MGQVYSVQLGGSSKDDGEVKPVMVGNGNYQRPLGIPTPERERDIRPANEPTILDGSTRSMAVDASGNVQSIGPRKHVVGGDIDGNHAVRRVWWPQRDSNPCFSLERLITFRYLAMSYVTIDRRCSPAKQLREVNSSTGLNLHTEREGRVDRKRHKTGGEECDYRNVRTGGVHEIAEDTAQVNLLGRRVGRTPLRWRTRAPAFVTISSRSS
jgi:hypothetical protein